MQQKFLKLHSFSIRSTHTVWGYLFDFEWNPLCVLVCMQVYIHDKNVFLGK